MIASVHVADVGGLGALGVLRKAPKSPGLRHANVALTAPLSAKLRPSPSFGRVALVAFWDDDAAVDRFLAEHPMAKKLADGWRVRLAPLRAFGTWPGLPEDTPRSRTVDHEGPAAVLTLGRLRLTQAPRFFKASAKAEGAVVDAPGLIWATGLSKPPFVSTCSLWQSSDALSAYAFGPDDAPHPGAMAADRAKPFHHQSAFIRFRPYGSEGKLDGRNPLAESWMATA